MAKVQHRFRQWWSYSEEQKHKEKRNFNEAAGMEGGTDMANEIIDFIPTGRENAISRKRLTELCVENDLIDTNKKDKDREMRLLLQKARIDYTILNNPEGGYYRPSREDLQELSRYIRQEEKRAKSIFKDVKRAKRLYEDYKLGRLEQEGEPRKVCCR